MIFTFEGREWDYDQDKITVDQFREMKRKYKLTAKGFSDGIEDGDPDALTCMYWTMQVQNGEPSAMLTDKINFPVGPLYTAVAGAQAAEEAAERERQAAELEAAAAAAAAVPTPPAGPLSPESPCPPDTTRTPPVPLPAAVVLSSTGSGAATLSSSAPSTSFSLPGSAGFQPARSEG